MNSFRKRIPAGVAVLITCLVACKDTAQTTLVPRAHSYEEAVREFKIQDSLSFPPEKAILFIGSSSFTLWKNVQSYFPGYTIINRGFGGSTLADQLYYANDIILPYKPKQIVIYCGENDLAFDGVSATEVFERFKKLFGIIRDKFTDLPLIYISMKPSPSRRHLFSQMSEGNKLISDFLATQKNSVFIDVYSKMLHESGEPISDLFLSDSLHMSTRGYAIWQKAIEPFLLKE